jgi:DNA-directed RNA polymerase specialized sigma24 family protein
MWLKALKKSAHFSKLWKEEKQGILWAELRREGTKVGQEDDRYRRAQAAAAAGYSVYDIEFYTTGALGKLMPALVEAGFDVSKAMETAATGTDAAGIHIRSSDPFGGAENYLVVLVDVAAAYGRLPEGMRRLIRTYYGVRQDDTEQGRWDRDSLAGSMGLTPDALRTRVHRALQRLQGELGGENPWK